MKSRLLLFCFITLALVPMRIHGRFARIDTQRVPIDRILRNFEQRLSKDTNNVEFLYSLARVHSMAYSTNLQTVEITTNRFSKSVMPVFEHPAYDLGVPSRVHSRSNILAHATAKHHLTNAIGYYERAAIQIYKGTNATTHRRLILPIHIGLAWCMEQQGKREDAIKAYRKALRIAWHERKSTIM